SKEYQQKLTAVSDRLTALEKRGRGGDGNVGKAKKGLEQGKGFAAEGQFIKALTCLADVEFKLGLAEVAAENDADRAKLYKTEVSGAERELNALIKLGPTASPAPLEQLILLAKAKADRGL